MRRSIRRTPWRPGPPQADGARAGTQSIATLKGRIEAVYFASPAFSAGRLRTPTGEQVKFAGALMVQEHDSVILHGAWETHPKFGRQFKVVHFTYDQALDPEGLAHFLAHHPEVKGIGPVMARRIAMAFGTDFEHVLTGEPERITRECRVPAKAVETLREIWARTRALNASMTWLAAFGLTHHQVTTLIEKFGNNIVAVLKTDPYLLAGEVRGFGFARIDLVARKLGTPKDHPSRIRAGIVHCVHDRLDQGDCWVEYQDLVERANLLSILDDLNSRTTIAGHLDGLIAEARLASIALGGRFLVARPDIHAMEVDLAGWIAQGRQANPHFGVTTRPQDLARRSAPGLNAGQAEALAACIRARQVLIAGAAGSGKTFVVAAITRLYEQHKLKVVLAAPTGKAAKRMEEVVGRPASTIHRLLGYNGQEYRHGPKDPIDADVVIVDEVSMVDVCLAWRLYRALDLDRTAVVLVGDPNQLPPVGPGNILRDLVERRPIPTVILDQVVRQAGVLRENSMAILRGQVARTSPPEGPSDRHPWVLVDRHREVQEVQRYVLSLYEKVLVERLHFDLVTDVQLLTPTHKGPLGTAALNVALQRLIQKKVWGVEVPPPPPNRRPTFLLHDKVIQCRNNYDLGVMNGTLGVVTAVGPKRGHLKVRFDSAEVEVSPGTGGLGDLALAYALTVHRTQGSEFPCAIVLVHKAHSFMHHRNLFYTGVTRAQETVIVVGDAWGIKNCAAKRQVEDRKTFLSVLDLPRGLGDGGSKNIFGGAA